MSRKLVLASHGKFAEGLLHSVEMIIGPPSCEVEVYGLEHGGNPFDYAKELEEEIRLNPEREFVIVCDLFGASIANAMSLLTGYENVFVFTGMSAGLVLSLLLSYTDPLDEDGIKGVLDETKQGVQVIRLTEDSSESEDF
ncbi:MAG: PTS fructose transporter subunit IIA [Tissierellia bacterium]|nr:PTS fructose transporter subunit IIA [Tissierellia bacterium]